MSAAPRLTPAPVTATPSLLLLDRDALLRQLEDAREENARLRAELAATMLPYRGHTPLVVGKTLMVVLHGGDTYQRVLKSIDEPDVYGERWVWEKVESVPTSPAARIDAVAAALTEMGCVGEQLERSA